MLREPRDLCDFAVTPPLQEQPQYFSIILYGPPLAMKGQRLLRCPFTAEQATARQRYRVSGNVQPTRRMSNRIRLFTHALITVFTTSLITLSATDITTSFATDLMTLFTTGGTARPAGWVGL